MTTKTCDWCDKPLELIEKRDAAGVVHLICRECWKDHLRDLGKIYEAINGLAKKRGAE